MAKLDELIVELKADIGGLKSQLAVANRELDRTGSTTERTSDRMRKAFQAVGAAAAALAVIKLGKEVINTTAMFQQLEARLITATGTLEGASLAFSQLTEFTTQTPFQLQSVVSAFISLRQQGIQPTFEQFRAMGDAAAATGNDITRFSEAVVGALVGETERLKAFGIQTRIQGEQISFTFNGVTKTVNRNAKEIVAALTEVSNQNFAGGMQRQMDTLGGSFSNLKDSMTVFANTLGELVAPIVQKTTQLLTSMFGILDAMVKRFFDLGEAAPAAAEAVAGASETMAGTRIGQIGMGGNEEAEEDPAITRQQKIGEIIKGMDEKDKEDALRREADFQRKMAQFKKSGAAERVKTVAQELQSIIGNTASSNKVLFNLNKAAALAQAALEARETVVSAYKFGTRIGGPVVGAAFAAAAGAAQAANISQIASASFGGGGGGGVPTVGTAPVNQFGQRTDVGGPAGNSAQRNVTINIDSDTGVFTTQQVRSLINQINEAVGDGATLNLGGI